MRKHFEFALAVAYENIGIVLGATAFWFCFISLSWALRG